jgi:hypothetical protein
VGKVKRTPGETREQRMFAPEDYWCIGFEDAPTKFFWDEVPVTEEEYTTGTKGKRPC